MTLVSGELDTTEIFLRPQVKTSKSQLSNEGNRESSSRKQMLSELV